MAKPVGDDASTNSSGFENTHPHYLRDLPQFENFDLLQPTVHSLFFFFLFLPEALHSTSFLVMKDFAYLLQVHLTDSSTD